MTINIEPELLNDLCRINENSGIPQEIYVIEECSELLKELSKKARGKENVDSIIEELCDVVCTTLILLYKFKISDQYIQNQVTFKMKRAIDRADDGEY